MENPGGKTSRRSRPAARRGGPANFQGTGYQVDVAVFEVLRLIQSELWRPDSGASASMEARIVDSTGQTGFDLAIHPRNLHFEAKLSPNRRELMDWLGNLPEAHERESRAVFTLVHAGGGASVADLAEIRRVAHEARDESHFTELCTATLDDRQRALLQALGVRARDVARQIEVVQRSEQELKDRTSWMAEGLSGTNGARLVETITQEIRGACAERRTIGIAGLIEKIRSLGLYLHAPLEVDGSLSAAACALVVLQACKDPVPIDVLAGAVGTDAGTLTCDLADYVERGMVRFADSMVSARPLPSRLTNERANDLFSRTLRALVEVCRDRERRSVAMSQVRNIARLSEICLSIDPELVASVFPAGDKLLKATGDLHLVLDIARLSIRAAGRSPYSGGPPSVQMLRDRAQSLICGVSWVYQRIDRLAEARVHAEESLKIGEELGWTRNTAFCKKCIGCLLRLEAEGCDDDEHRKSLLQYSVASLKEAIPLFENGQDADLGKNCEDVGECHSLMGRTFLIAKDPKSSRSCIATAREILERFRPTKAWADLVILDGEISLREGRFQIAN